MSRLQLGRLIRIITGHKKLKYHSSVIDPLLSPFCSFCGTEPETFFHFVSSCPMLQNLRIQYFSHRNIFADLNWKISELLDFSYETCINDLLDPHDVHNIDLADTESDDDNM